MLELTNVRTGPFTGPEFKSWCERQGMKVNFVRRNPRGRLRAFLYMFYGKYRAHIVELSGDGGHVYLRRVDDKGREVLCEEMVTR